MKFILRWAFRLVILLVVLVVALVLLKDTIIKAVAESSIQGQTGLEAKIDRFEVGLLTPTVTIENFTLYNAPEFGGSPFVVIPELHVEFDRAAAALGRIHLSLVRFNLGEVNIVQDKAGRLNYQELQAALAKQSAARKSKSGTEFSGIDTLNLSLGKVKYTSLKPGGKTWERNLGIRNEIVQNVKSASDLNTMILKIILKQGIDLAGEIQPSESLRDPGRKTERGTRNPFDGLPTPLRK